MGVLEVHDVSIRYITGDFKDIGLKEYTMKKLKGDYHVTEFWADYNISFTLEKGELLGIIGTNGAGKSTLLKAVSGIMEPTTGYVKRKGNIAALLELASGFDGDLTVKENAYLRGAMLGYTRKFMDETYDQIIDFAELRDFQDRPFRQLSSGMKSRLAFSIASLVQPDILILDEVLSVGDGAFRKKSEEKMKEIIAGGAATILVSHSIEQVRNLCTKVLWLDHGRQIILSDDVEGTCALYTKFLNKEIKIEDVCPLPKCIGAEPADAKIQFKKIDKDTSLVKPLVEKGDTNAKNIENCTIITKKINRKLLISYTLLFLITFLLAYSPFLLAGKAFIWSADARTQHYPAIIYIGQYWRGVLRSILAGEATFPMFDLNIGLGGDIIGTLNYYGFGDPLTLLSSFVPMEYSEYLYGFLIVLRLYLAGLAFCFLSRYFGKASSYSLIGSLLYVFSGFAVVSAVRHPFFINPMIQLPLLIVGVEKLLRRGKPYLFIAAVFYTAVCGYYFLYMMTILLGIYAIIRFFEMYRRRRLMEIGKLAVRGIGCYLLGIGLSGAIFIPAVIAFLSSGRSGVTGKQNLLSYGWNYYRMYFFKLIAPPASWDALAMAAICLLAVVLLLIQRKKHRSLVRLLVAAVGIFILPVCGYVLNGFAYPSQRWTFAFAMLLSYITVEMLPDLLCFVGKRKMVCVVFTFVYTAVVFSCGKIRSAAYLVGVIMLFASVTTLMLLSGEKGQEETIKFKTGKWSVTIICIGLVIANVGVNAIYRFASDQSNYIGEFAEYGTEIKRLTNAIERKAEPYLVGAEGRFDGSSFSRNVGTIWHVPTPASFWSILDKNTTEFWTKIESASQSGAAHNILGTDQRTMVDALLSEKYLLEKAGDENRVPFGFQNVETLGGGVNLYENLYALPWGYTYDEAMSYEYLDSMNGLKKQEAVLQKIALEESGDIFGNTEALIYTANKLPYKISSKENIEWKDGELSVEKDNGTLILEYDMPPNVEGYFYLKGFTINELGPSNFNISFECNGIKKSASALSPTFSWYFGREDYLINMGYSEKRRTTCKITFPKKGSYQLEDIEVYAQPMDNYVVAVEKLREEPLENIVMETNHISGTVDLSKNKILCMSIPYSKGWSAIVDGEPVEILRGNYMFMAIPLEAGHHEIEFHYCTPGLKLGLMTMGASVAVLIFMLCRDKKKRQATDLSVKEKEK